MKYIRQRLEEIYYSDVWKVCESLPKNAHTILSSFLSDYARAATKSHPESTTYKSAGSDLLEVFDRYDQSIVGSNLKSEIDGLAVNLHTAWDIERLYMDDVWKVCKKIPGGVNNIIASTALWSYADSARLVDVKPAEREKVGKSLLALFEKQGYSAVGTVLKREVDTLAANMLEMLQPELSEQQLPCLRTRT